MGSPRLSRSSSRCDWPAQTPPNDVVKQGPRRCERFTQNSRFGVPTDDLSGTASQGAQVHITHCCVRGVVQYGQVLKLYLTNNVSFTPISPSVCALKSCVHHKHNVTPLNFPTRTRSLDAGRACIPAKTNLSIQNKCRITCLRERFSTTNLGLQCNATII